MAFQIPRPRTAFSLQPTGKNSGRIDDKDYLAWIRQFPCAVSGMFPTEAAHVSMARPEFGKLGRGKGSKESDRWVLPMTPAAHAESHHLGESRYWEMIGLDPCIIAMALWAAYPDEEKALLVLEHSMRQAKQKRT